MIPMCYVVLLLRQRFMPFVIAQKRKSYGKALELVSLKTPFSNNRWSCGWKILWLENKLFSESWIIKGMEGPLIFMTGHCLLLYCTNLSIFEAINDAHAFFYCRVIKLTEDYHGNMWSVIAARTIHTFIIKHVVWTSPLRIGLKSTQIDGSCLDVLATTACGGIARNYDDQFLAA